MPRNLNMTSSYLVEDSGSPVVLCGLTSSALWNGLSVCYVFTTVSQTVTESTLNPLKKRLVIVLKELSFRNFSDFTKFSNLFFSMSLLERIVELNIKISKSKK